MTADIRDELAKMRVWLHEALMRNEVDKRARAERAPRFSYHRRTSSSFRRWAYFLVKAN
ncbi:MAG: hypothetical protein NWE83_05175 [Candidatus Bathyarchaeota archaeon]|nr:hypothetical protein [Candidatus Bathyarchaeota archaeon]